LGKHPRKSNTDDASSYLDNVGDRYVFNGISGLYEPKSKDPKDEGKNNSAESYRKSPFKLDIKRDWMALVISAVSLMLFGYTIHYARLQWQAMDASVVQSKRSADEAHAAVGKASEALAQSRKQLFRMKGLISGTTTTKRAKVRVVI
jgi:hypothetical protein